MTDTSNPKQIMNLIDEIKHNLQIGAPKLTARQKNLQLRAADTISINTILDGRHDGCHVSSMRYTLWAVQPDPHGHEAYAVHTETTHKNNEQGWDLNPHQKTEINRLIDLHNPPQTTQPLLLSVTADIGRGADNPHLQLWLHIN